MLREENNLTLIIYYAIFSFGAATIYFFVQAPDLALAEIAVGCAFIPLIYVIAIGKLKTFTVVIHCYDKGNKCEYNEEAKEELLKLLNDFCYLYALELNVIWAVREEDAPVTSIFRVGNTDLIVNYLNALKQFEIQGNSSNIMMPRLEKMIAASTCVKLKKVVIHDEEENE